MAKKTTKSNDKEEKKSTKRSDSVKKSSAKEPTTMEELLAKSGYDIQVPQKGEIITGLVTNVNRKMVFVDIGAKTEGIVSDKEYDSAREYIETLSPGDEVEVYIVSDENEKGQILLSLRRAMIGKLWDMLVQYLEGGESVVVKGAELNRGGMIVKWQGIRGFVPSSQFGAASASNLKDLVGQRFKVKPIEVDPEKNRLIFSEKHVSEAAMLEAREKALSSVKVDDVYDGIVSGIMSFGAFVGVEVPVEDGKKGKVEGLVHISEISWEKVNDINNYLKNGDKVKVKVLGVEEGTGKLNLSIKQLQADPWDSVEKNYAVGSKVKGKVSRIAPFGVFVNFEPGVDGLIHVSKVPSGDELKIGQEIDVFVESLDVSHRRMSLGIMLTEVPVGYK